MTFARDLASFADSASQNLSNRNLIINGAMQIAQRGTSTTGITTDGIYTADRWNSQIGTLGTWTQTLENDAPTGSGFRKSLKWLCTTADASPAAGDYMICDYRFEGQNLQQIAKGTSSAKQLSLSFWVKSNVTGTYIVNLYDVDNTRFVAASYTVSASATWEKKTITLPADTTGVFDNDNAYSLDLQFWLGAGTTFTSGTLGTSWATNTNANRAVGQTNLASATNNYWQITGVQLETGPAATPYEFKPYDVELAQCQRYFIRYSDAQYYAQWTSGAYLRFQILNPVTQRVSGTFSYTGTLQTNIYYEVAGVGTSGTVNALSDVSATVNTHLLQVTFSANPSAGAGRLITSSSNFDFSAEL